MPPKFVSQDFEFPEGEPIPEHVEGDWEIIIHEPTANQETGSDPQAWKTEILYLGADQTITYRLDNNDRIQRQTKRYIRLAQNEDGEHIIDPVEQEQFILNHEDCQVTEDGCWIIGWRELQGEEKLAYARHKTMAWNV